MKLLINSTKINKPGIAKIKISAERPHKRRARMSADADRGSLDAVVKLLCPACNEVSALRETWIEDYGNGLLMRGCPKCDCESAADEWRESSPTTKLNHE
jgi:hypothetical protein